MNELNIYFYFGDHGDTLLIRTDNIEKLIMLKEIFNKLANNVINEYNFKQIEEAKFAGINDVVITNHSTHVNVKEKKSVIYWEQPETDWYNCEGLIAGLLEDKESKTGGHQYFTGSEDVITVEISYSETLK